SIAAKLACFDGSAGLRAPACMIASARVGSKPRTDPRPNQRALWQAEFLVERGAEAIVASRQDRFGEVSFGSRGSPPGQLGPPQIHVRSSPDSRHYNARWCGRGGAVRHPPKPVTGTDVSGCSKLDPE